MRSTNRKRALLVSASVILLCMTVIVGMTWALFTDTETVQNHLRAGDLTIELTRTNLTKTTLNDKGYLVEVGNDEDVPFSNPTHKNVFDLKTDDKGEVTEVIVPGSKYVAEMRLDNTSDVAFGYWIELVMDKDADAKLLEECLKVTVATDGDHVKTMGEDLKIGSDGAFIDVLEIGQSGTFTVTVEFPDSDYDFDANGNLVSDDNQAEGKSLNFDLIVYAVQVTEAATTAP